MINNTDEYVSLMKERAVGALPDMGCALRVGALIRERTSRLPDGGTGIQILDVGCATGHFLRTFMGQKLPVAKYVGLEVDPAMVAGAREIWSDQIGCGAAEFVNESLDRFTSNIKFDFVICECVHVFRLSKGRADKLDEGDTAPPARPKLLCGFELPHYEGSD
jgi:SAM-dependent methyltransferase